MAQKKKGSRNQPKSKNMSKTPNQVKKTPTNVVRSEAKVKTTEVMKKKPVTEESEISQSRSPQLKIKLVKPNFKKFALYVLLIVTTLIVVDFIVQYINNDYSVAIVNGYRISRSEYEKRLEEAYGEVIASQLVNEQLIIQEAAKDEITVTEEDIQELVDQTIEDIGGQEAFESALEANGLTEEAYRRNLKIQLLAEKMIVTEPSEEDLLAFYEEYKDVYFGEESKYEDVKEDVADLYKSQKFNEESSAWLTEIRDSSTIQNNVSNPPKYGLLKITRDLLTDFNNRLNDGQDTEEESEKESETEAEDETEVETETETETE